MDEQKVLAQEILEAIGGADNVSSLGHCMTRLRFNLKDASKADDVAVRKVKGVKGVSKAGGQYQLIIGTGTVEEYFNAINSIATFAQEDYSGAKNVNVFDMIMDVLSGSITPWLGVLMGALILQAILSLFNSLGVLDSTAPTYLFFYYISSACTYSFPVLIGFTAAEKFNTNRYMGAFIGAVLIYPTMMTAISEGTVGVFGIPIQSYSYTSTILPVILACWLLKYVEKLAKKICPKVIYIFGVTLIEIVIVVPLTYLVVGPIGNTISGALMNFILWVYSVAGPLAPAVVSMLLPVLVMAGLHAGLMPIITMMISDIGYDPVIMVSFMAYNVGVAGVSLAYALRSKDKDQKSIGFSAALSGVLGISEPALFGVILVNKTVLISTTIGMFLSGAAVGLSGYKVTVPISQSIFSIPAAAGIEGNVVACIIAFTSTIVINFIVTYIALGLEKRKK
jgi:PTS system beta-glucosides-specific IIC component